MKNIISILTKLKKVQMTPSEKDSVWRTISYQTFEKDTDANIRKPIVSSMYYEGIFSMLKTQNISFINKKYNYFN